MVFKPPSVLSPEGANYPVPHVNLVQIRNQTFNH